LCFYDQNSLRRDFLRDSALKIQNSITYTLFFMVLMQSGLRNPDSTTVNSEHVCNIDSHFKDKTSYGTPPSKSIIPSFRPFFFMVLMQSGLRNPDCKRAFLKILQGVREGNRVGKVILFFFLSFFYKLGRDMKLNLALLMQIAICTSTFLSFDICTPFIKKARALGRRTPDRCLGPALSESICV